MQCFLTDGRLFGKMKTSGGQFSLCEQITFICKPHNKWVLELLSYKSPHKWGSVQFKYCLTFCFGAIAKWNTKFLFWSVFDLFVSKNIGLIWNSRQYLDLVMVFINKYVSPIIVIPLLLMLLLFAMLGIRSMTSNMLSKLSTTELHPSFFPIY